MADVQTINAHSNGVCDVAFDRTGAYLASCGTDTLVRLYDVPAAATGDLQQHSTKEADHNTIALSFTADAVRPDLSRFSLPALLVSSCSLN